MPRLVTAVPKYCRHRATGQAVVTLNGRDHYLGRYDSAASRTEYNRLIADWLVGGRQPLPELQARSILVDELFLRYLDHAEKTYVRNGVPTTSMDNVRAVIRRLSDRIGGLLVDAVRPRHFDDWIGAMVAEGLKRTTIRRWLGIGKDIWKWGVRTDLVAGETFYRLMTVSAPRRGQFGLKDGSRRKPVPLRDIGAIRHGISPQVRAMIHVQYLAGMRPEAVVAMRPADIEKRPDGVWLYRVRDHKMDRFGYAMVHPLGTRAQRVLRRFMDRDPEAFLFSPVEAEAYRAAVRRRLRATPITPSQLARRRKEKRIRSPKPQYTTDSYRRAVERACRLLGVAVWTPGRLRHTGASRARRLSDLETASLLCGQRSLDVTEFYAERDLNRAIAAAKRFG